MSRIAHIPSRVLPAAGAYYTGATQTALLGSWLNAQGESFVTLAITYTKAVAATNGRAKCRILWTSVDDAGQEADFYETVADGTITISGVTATAFVYHLDYDLVVTTDGNPIRVLVDIRVPRAVFKIKVEPAEVGDVANPGTIVVEIEGRV